MKDTPALRKLSGRRYSFRAPSLSAFARLCSRLRRFCLLLVVLARELETLTARRRSCHECTGWHGALRLTKRKRAAWARHLLLRGYARVPGAAGAFLLGAVALNCCTNCCTRCSTQCPSTTRNAPEGSRTINQIPAKQSLRYNSRNDGL